MCSNNPKLSKKLVWSSPGTTRDHYVVIVSDPPNGPICIESGPQIPGPQFRAPNLGPLNLVVLAIFENLPMSRSGLYFMVL